MQPESIFKHHPDGYVIINGELFPLAVFTSVETGYIGPDAHGFIGREYVPGIRHFLHTSDSSEPQPLSWPEGDGYIENIQAYRDALAGLEGGA